MTALAYRLNVPVEPRAHLTRCDWPRCRWTYVGEQAKAEQPLREHLARMHAGKKP